MRFQGLVLQLRDIFKGYLYKMHPDYDNSDESPFAHDVTDHYPIEVFVFKTNPEQISQIKFQSRLFLTLRLMKRGLQWKLTNLTS